MEPRSAYLVGGRRIDADAPGFADAIADAHASHQRPLCLCVAGDAEPGVEMYVARLAGTDAGYIVKRMPNTGSRHAPDCPSYEPPAELSGLGQVLGSAIQEDPATGETKLRLDFALTKLEGRAGMPVGIAVGSDGGDSVTSEGTRLSLRGLLHYLWEQAELNRWHPGFAGKRSWGTVRRHLLVAAQNKFARTGALASKLYMPEVFSVEQRDAINARRLARWAAAMPQAGKVQQLMLLIAEAKEIVPARYGFKAIVKHLPDQGFAIDEQLYRRLGRRFEQELALWGAAADVHMVVVATFSVSGTGVPAVVEMSLMPVTAQWLPIEDAFERQVVGHLVAEGRTFIKALRYNLHRGQGGATVVLTDTGDAPSPMFIVPPGLEETGTVEGTSGEDVCCDPPGWVWRPGLGAMPRLPAARRGSLPPAA